MALRKLSLSLLSLFVLSCSFTVASNGNFHECDKDSDCKNGLVCQQNFCVTNTVPDGCGQSYGSTDPNAIQFAAALPMNPPEGTDQSEIAGLNAIKLAIDEINQYTISGKQLALNICDTHADADQVKAQADWLIKQKKVVAIVTSGSGQTIAASTVTIPAGVVLMSATSTSPAITDLSASPNGTRLVWRTAPSDALQGAAIAKKLSDADAGFGSVSKVGIINLSDPYGQGLKAVLLSKITSPKTAQSFVYDRGGDVTSAVAALNTFNPDLTVCIAFPDDAVNIIQKAVSLPSSNLTKAAGHQWFFTDSAKDPALLSGLGATASEVDGDYGTNPAQGAGNAYQLFHDSFMSKFGIDPGSFAFTSNAYDATYVLALGAAYAANGGAGTIDGAHVAEGLTKLSSGTTYLLSPDQFLGAVNDLSKGTSVNVDGASGPLDFDPATGEAPAKIELWQVTGSSFTTRELISP